MEEIFVTKLRINKVRHLENLEIPLSDTERKHLILTGKNGSGKTSVLEGISTFIQNTVSNKVTNEVLDDLEGNYIKYLSYLINQKTSLPNIYKARDGFGTKSIIIQLSSVENSLKQIQEQLAKIAPCSFRANISNDTFGQEIGNRLQAFIFKFFQSKRFFFPNESNGPQKIDLKDYYELNENINENFVRQLVNLRLDLLDAKDLGKTDEVNKIEEWFRSFTNILREIFEDETLELVFDRQNFNYNIITKKNDSFNLNQLSDGYSSFLAIITELIMRISGTNYTIHSYDAQGLVLIDEIENHLHISLQKKILPFLTTFFPKIQFIVTTHSPFVLSSIDNAVIYDLEKQERVEDLSAYSYTNIVKGYFETDEYSQEVKEKIREYEKLVEKSKHDTGLLTLEEKEKYYDLKKYFEQLPKTLSPELQLKIQQLELSRLAQ